MLFLAFIKEAQPLSFSDDNRSDLKLPPDKPKRNKNVDFRGGTELGSMPEP
jgi:hypothetical protein